MHLSVPSHILCMILRLIKSVVLKQKNVHILFCYCHSFDDMGQNRVVLDSEIFSFRFVQLIACAESRGFTMETRSNKTLAHSLDKCVDPNDPNFNRVS